jgi:hypothetical protein
MMDEIENVTATQGDDATVEAEEPKAGDSPMAEVDFTFLANSTRVWSEHSVFGFASTFHISQSTFG